MVQFLSIIFFSWISSIFVGFFKSSRFFVCHSVLLWPHFRKFVDMTDGRNVFYLEVAILKHFINFERDPITNMMLSSPPDVAMSCCLLSGRAPDLNCIR